MRVVRGRCSSWTEAPPVRSAWSSEALFGEFAGAFSYAATAISSLPSDWHAAVALWPVTPVRAKMTVAARMPRTTMTIRSSIRVKPGSNSTPLRRATVSRMCLIMCGDTAFRFGQPETIQLQGVSIANQERLKRTTFIGRKAMFLSQFIAIIPTMLCVLSTDFAASVKIFEGSCGCIVNASIGSSPGGRCRTWQRPERRPRSRR